MPALGFAVDVDHLLITLERQDINVSFEDKKLMNFSAEALCFELLVIAHPEASAETLRRYKSKVLMVLAEDSDHANKLSEEFSKYEIKRLI